MLLRDRENLHKPRSMDLWQLVFPTAVWAIHFVLVYAGTAVFCARFAGASADLAGVRIYIIAVTLVALVLIAILGLRAWRLWNSNQDSNETYDESTNERRTEFFGHVGFLLSLVSFIGVVYVALPILFIGNCT